MQAGQKREFLLLNQYFILQNPASFDGLGEEFVAFVPALELVHSPRPLVLASENRRPLNTSGTRGEGKLDAVQGE